MKTVKKNVYYCDFCNKRGLSAGHMRAHEKHCTANPNRSCRICGSGFRDPISSEDFKARYKIIETEKNGFVSFKIKWIGPKITMDEIDNIVDDCPACKLSLFRLSGLTHHVFHDTLKFDYKEALAKYWKERNDEEARSDMYGYG